jgi:glutaredoxin
MNTKDSKALITNSINEDSMSAPTLVKYVVQNKLERKGEDLKTPQVFIGGKPRKAGETLTLNPDAYTTKDLLGTGWILPASEVEEKTTAKK